MSNPFSNQPGRQTLKPTSSNPFAIKMQPKAVKVEEIFDEVDTVTQQQEMKQSKAPRAKRSVTYTQSSAPQFQGVFENAQLQEQLKNVGLQDDGQLPPTKLLGEQLIDKINVNLNVIEVPDSVLTNYLFDGWQLMQIPCLLPSKDVRRLNVLPKNQKESGYGGLFQVKQGKIGRYVKYKSGKVKIVLNNGEELECLEGGDRGVQQDVVVVSEERNLVQSLGPISGKKVFVVDF